MSYPDPDGAPDALVPMLVPNVMVSITSVVGDAVPL
jgi:hypothetical protein